MTADLFTKVAPFGFDDGATFSPCRGYRYHLWRSWGNRERRVAFVGLNPSTADETRDDPTIRKCIGFAKRWGFEAIDMVNLFAWRSTDPTGLRLVVDPVGPANDETLTRVLFDAARVVLAWGSHAPVRTLIAQRVAALSLTHTLQGFTLGRSKDGSPRHPLMLAYSTPLEPT